MPHAGIRVLSLCQFEAFQRINALESLPLPNRRTLTSCRVGEALPTMPSVGDLVCLADHHGEEVGNPRKRRRLQGRRGYQRTVRASQLAVGAVAAATIVGR